LLYFCARNCNKPVIDQALNRAVVNLFEHDGVEAWHSPAADSLLRHATTCAHCGGKAFRKETDILDVWFDSGQAGLRWLKSIRSQRRLHSISK